MARAIVQQSILICLLKVFHGKMNQHATGGQAIDIALH